MDVDSDFNDESMYSDDFEGDGVEDAYYGAKALKEDDPELALQELGRIRSQEPNSEWSIRSCKQALKINCILKRCDEELLSAFLDVVRELKDAKGVAESYKVRSFMKMAQLAERCGLEPSSIYQSSLEILRDSKLGSTPALSLARYYAGIGDTAAAKKVLDKIDDERPQLEILALKMQIALDTPEMEHSLGELYEMAAAIKTEIAPPQVLAVIYEVGGIKHLRSSQWELGSELLFKSFKSYDEAGNPESRLRVLQLYILAMLIMDRDPFDMHEIKAFESNLSVSGLVHSYLSHDVKEFSLLFHQLPRFPQVPRLLPQLKSSFDCRTMLWLIKPYSRVKLSYLEAELNLTREQLRPLVIQSILDNHLNKMLLNNVDEVLEESESLPERLQIYTAPSISLPARFMSVSSARAQKQVEQRILNSHDGTAADSRVYENEHTTTKATAAAESMSKLLSAVKRYHNSVSLHEG